MVDIEGVPNICDFEISVRPRKGPNTPFSGRALANWIQKIEDSCPTMSDPVYPHWPKFLKEMLAFSSFNITKDIIFSIRFHRDDQKPFFEYHFCNGMYDRATAVYKIAPVNRHLFA